MNCQSVEELADLYLYGELAAQEEEDFEQHLHGCTACQGKLDRRSELHRGFDSLRVAAPAALLAECRRELFQAKSIQKAPPFWAGLLTAWRQPVGALALVALGFYSARITNREVPAGANLASLAGEPIVSTIRSVQPGASGQVRIALDETRRRMISGNLSDGNIERLMLAAARDEANDGLRVDSIDILKNHAASTDIRDALLSALRNDPNPGVRFKALDALKGMTSQPEVRKTLGFVLQNDQNPGVRIAAIDLLAERQDGDVVGVLQQLVTRESNSYVRQRCERALQEMNASVGTF